MPDQTPPAKLSPQPYRGRFAPSPSGPLHFGSLIAATGSYLQAKSQQGEWLIRIDDVDPPREVAGASDAILTTLEHFGFEWDGPVSFQSQRNDIYRDALNTLQRKGYIYPCACSRKQIAEAQTSSTTNAIYPGTCRNGLTQNQSIHTLRMNTQGAIIQFNDLLQGNCQYNLGTEIGDYIVLRAGGLFAYQLATGVDDALQGITEVVRGNDLLDSTPCQMLIQQHLGLDTAVYCHLPVVINDQGQKLSKRNQAPTLIDKQASVQILQALVFLGQNPPIVLKQESVSNIWQWAIANWQYAKITRQQTIPYQNIAQLKNQNYF